MRVLVPVDGSERSHRAVEYLIRSSVESAWTEVRLLNVQPPLPVLKSWRLRREDIRREQQERGQRALGHARALLEEAGIRHEHHVTVGPAAETIVSHAKRWKCDSIVMGTRGIGSTPNLVVGSVAMKVIHLAECPVTLVN